MDLSDYDACCREYLQRFDLVLLDRINSGSFGTVYRARQIVAGASDSGLDHADPSDIVALKIIDEAPRYERLCAHTTNATELSNYLMAHRGTIRREVANGMKLRGNPNIVTIISAGSFPSPIRPHDCECQFIVMEKMRGTLRELIRGNALKMTDRVRIALDAIRALHFAHSRAVAHRDIKPENLLVANAVNLALKIGDFGIAVDYAVPDFRRSGITFAGSFPYVAPEVLYMHEELSTPVPLSGASMLSLRWDLADVFSLGVTLYELFMDGKYPYSMSDTIGARARALDSQSYDRVVRNNAIPRIVAETIEAMLRRDPTERVSLEDACVNLEGAVGECHVEFGTDPTPGLNHKVTRMVRGSLRKKIDTVVRELIPELAPVPGLSPEHQNWYLNVLLRPTERPDAAHAVMSQYLCPVYGVHVVGTQVVHWDHWDQSRELVSIRVAIADSCCGLPIELMRPGHQLVGLGLKSSGNVTAPIYPTRDDVISFVQIVNLMHERFGADSNPVVSRRYKTDHGRHDHTHGDLRGNGWHYRPVDDEDGPVHLMSQAIQTEIVVPIYAPSRRRHLRTSDDICGVLNIEWEWSPAGEDLKRIGDYLVETIHRDKIFPISEFLSEIVSIATTLRY